MATCIICGKATENEPIMTGRGTLEVVCDDDLAKMAEMLESYARHLREDPRPEPGPYDIECYGEMWEQINLERAR